MLGENCPQLRLNSASRTGREGGLSITLQRTRKREGSVGSFSLPAVWVKTLSSQLKTKAGGRQTQRCWQKMKRDVRVSAPDTGHLLLPTEPISDGERELEKWAGCRSETRVQAVILLPSVVRTPPRLTHWIVIDDG